VPLGLEPSQGSTSAFSTFVTSHLFRQYSEVSGSDQRRLAHRGIRLLPYTPKFPQKNRTSYRADALSERLKFFLKVFRVLR